MFRAGGENINPNMELELLPEDIAPQTSSSPLLCHLIPKFRFLRANANTIYGLSFGCICERSVRKDNRHHGENGQEGAILADFSAESSVSPKKCCSRAPADDNGARVSAIYSGTRVGVATPLPGRMYNCDWF